MTPFYLFFGVLFVYILRSQIDLKKIKLFIYSFLFLFFLSPIIYSYISVSQTDKRTDYPGKEIANKVQFLYRIHKGKFDVFDNAGVNNKIEDKKVYIPFENIFFFGDGETDIPTFVVNKKNGGTTICVYENDETSKKNAKKILREKRVNYIVENDYSENGPIEKLINTIMELNINFSVSS